MKKILSMLCVLFLLISVTAPLLSVVNSRANHLHIHSQSLTEDMSSASGPIKALPWENDENFKKAQEQSGSYVLMAGFRTVLRDPLPGEEENVHLGASYLAGIVLKPGEVLSQNYSLGPYTGDRGYKIGPTYAAGAFIKTVGGGVCKIASTLYNVSILSDLSIVERYCHSMPVPYVPYGQDATVSYGNKDFKFKNNKDYPVLIWAQGIDNILYIAFYGREEAPSVKWYHETLSFQNAGVKYRLNQDLPKGTERVIMEGMDGGSVKSWVTVTLPNGTSTIRQLGVSYYQPIPTVIENNPG